MEKREVLEDLLAKETADIDNTIAIIDKYKVKHWGKVRHFAFNI